jgi:thioredoxin-dependent peroxiredoxin
MVERIGEAFEFDIKLTVVGAQLQVGDKAPEFDLENLDPGTEAMSNVKLSDSAGKVRLLNVINSIDTPVCHIETHRWQDEAARLPGLAVFTIAMDLPFALARWQKAEGVNHTFLSAHYNESFGVLYGVLLKEWRLLQRAVFVIDGDGAVVHAEYVADQMTEPDYGAALDAARSLLGVRV